MRTMSFCINWRCSQREQLPASTAFLSTPTPVQSGGRPSLPASVCSFPPVTNPNAAERGLKGALALPTMPCLFVVWRPLWQSSTVTSLPLAGHSNLLLIYFFASDPLSLTLSREDGLLFPGKILPFGFLLRPILLLGPCFSRVGPRWEQIYKMTRALGLVSESSARWSVPSSAYPHLTVMTLGGGGCVGG